MRFAVEETNESGLRSGQGLEEDVESFGNSI